MNQDDLLALAQVAYHAYGSVTEFLNYQGLPMPAWENPTPKIQQAWIAATQAVVDRDSK